MTMTRHEIEIALLQKVIFDSAQDQSGVALADLGNNHANGEAALGSQGAGEEIRPVVASAGSGEYAIFGVLRDRVRHGRAVYHQRHRGGRQAQFLRENLQADTWGRFSPSTRRGSCLF